jgi:hypothetical protein
MNLPTPPTTNPTDGAITGVAATRPLPTEAPPRREAPDRARTHPSDQTTERGAREWPP